MQILSQYKILILPFLLLKLMLMKNKEVSLISVLMTETEILTMNQSSLSVSHLFMRINY